MIKPIDINNIQEEKTNFFQVYKDTYIDVSVDLAPPPVALSIGTYNYKGNNYFIPFGTYGNFSCLVGASKSMKTFFKSALIAGYIGGQSQNYFPDIRGHNTDKKYVLDIDTEQSGWHTQRVARRVCEMVGDNHEYYKAFTLREKDAKIRFEFIEWLMMESEFKDRIGLVSIDGAADVLDSVNDLDLSNKIVQGMMKWTTATNSHILTVLHRNHGSDKPTGHLGSAIMKKSETVAFVERQDEWTIVTPKYCRNYPFEEFRFGLNEHHLPYHSEQENSFI